MRPSLRPSDISSLLPFQQSTQIALEKNDVTGIHANTSKDGRVSWLYHGPNVEVITTETRERLAAWQFGVVLKDTDTVVTCVKEYPCDGSMKLLVGLHNSSEQGMVCVLDISTSRVTKAIEIAQQVTSIEPVTFCGGDGIPRWAISEQLRNFHGIVAVGTHGGYVYLLDMCLDEYGDYSDEISPNTLKFITPRSRDITQRRQQAISKGQLLCMVLDEECFSRGNFNFRRPDEMVIKSFGIDSVSVTCLKYFPEAGNLAVGFSFGGFQLWKLYNPLMEYSSRLEAEPIAVSHFAYQEPENDPKNFSYLWVCRDDTLVNPGQEGISTVALYQLCYGKKTWYSGYGVFYEELHSVCLRLEYDLSANPFTSSSKNTWMSHIMSCYTLEDPYYTPPKLLTEDESFEEASHGPDLSLCVFVWEAQDNGSSDKTAYFLGLFDMNRWYYAQMPAFIRFTGVSMEMCPFFAIYQLSDITDAILPDAMLYLHIRRDSIKRYINNSPLTPEQHFFPSALAFDAFCIIETGLISATFKGLQRQIISDMEEMGASCLLQPQDLYNLCVFTGLLPRSLDLAVIPTPIFQRQALLCLALEHAMVKFIISCIAAWAEGEFVHQGCTLKFLLEWAWDRVAHTKQVLDTSCVSLYDWSGSQVDHRLQLVLHKSHRTLLHLRTVFHMLITQSAPTTEQGLLELETKLNVVLFLSQHLQVVLWMIDVGLLPENDEIEDPMNGCFCYPAGNLIQAFNNRRSELQRLHRDIKSTDLLLIDGIVASCGEAITSLWEREGGSGLYPPPSLHAVLNIYLVEDVSHGIKHSILMYLLLDLASLVSEDQHEQFTDQISKFAKSFAIPVNIVKQVQGFWLIDHQDFEDALALLLDPMVNRELGSWQHCRIIKSLLYQGESKMALRYISTCNAACNNQEEIKLRMTVFLANGLTTEAFDFQRSCRDKSNMSDLLSHLFLGCQQTKTVDQLLQLPLNDFEERHLVDYLLDSTEPHSPELLVMHYLQRARFIEAIRLNDKIKHTVMTETSAKARERAAARNSVVDGFTRALPAPQRKLISDQPSLPRKSAVQRINVKRPKPLSTTVTQSDRSRVVSHSGIIYAMMEKVQEVKRKLQEEIAESPEAEAQRDLGPFLCTPVTPHKKARLSDVQDVVFPKVKTEESEKQEPVFASLSRERMSVGSPASLSRSFLSSTLDKTRRTSRYMSADAMSLLQTPVITRKAPARPSTSFMQRTPQSILKVRRLITKSPSPMGSSHDFSELGTPKIPQKSKQLGFRDTMRGTLSPKAKPKGDTSIPGTPKLLRFAEPQLEDDDKTPTKISPTAPTPPSPSSPRTLRDRSPTPESMSPKIIPKKDSLIRRPIHFPERQPQTPENVEHPQSEVVDDDITFNYSKTQTEYTESMEYAEDSIHTSPAEPTPRHSEETTASSAEIEVSTVKISKSSQSQIISPSSSNFPSVEHEDVTTSVSEHDHGSLEEPIEIDLTEDYITLERAENEFRARFQGETVTSADSTEICNKIADSTDINESIDPTEEIMDKEDQNQEILEVSSTLSTEVTETRKKDKHTISQDVEEVPVAENTETTSTGISQVRSSRSPSRTIPSMIKEVTAESEELPALDIHEDTDRKPTQSSPNQSTKRSPGRSVQMSPPNSTQSESKTSQDEELPAPEEPEITRRMSTRSSPARSTRASPARSVKMSPARSKQEPPSQDSPAKPALTSPSRSARRMTRLKSQEESKTEPDMITNKFLEPLKIETEGSDFELAPLSPIRRSPRLMVKNLSRLQVKEGDDDTLVETDVVTAAQDSVSKTPVKRSTRKSQKDSQADPGFKTPPRHLAPPTPPESGKDTPEKSSDEAEEKLTRQRSRERSITPSRTSTTPTRHSTRLRTKEQSSSETSVEPLRLNLTEPVPESSSTNGSFHFSEPMHLEPELQERLEKWDTPTKSFIFSPPITRQQTQRESLGRAGETPQGTTPTTTPGVPSLLPPMPSEPKSTPKTRSAKPKQAKKERKKKTEEVPHSSPSDSPINFISPVPERRITRGMEKGEKNKKTSFSANLKAKIRKKRVAKLY